MISLIMIGFSIQTPYYSSDDSYFSLRNVENILESYKPLFQDDLSFGGRDSYFPPLFYYFLAFLEFFLPSFFIYKMLLSFLSASIVLVVYFISLKLTSDRFSSFLAALMAGFIPLNYTLLANKITPLSLLILVVFMLIYFFLDLKKYQTYFIVFSFILVLLHPMAILLVLAFLIYLLISYAEGATHERIRKEAILFYTFLAVLFLLIFFKRPLFELGTGIFFQNIPLELLSFNFMKVSLVDFLFRFGFLPLVFGVMGIMVGLNLRDKRPVYLIGSFMISISILLLARSMDFFVGMLFLGLSLTIMSSLFFKGTILYIEKTKFSKYKVFAFSLFIILVFFNLMVPSITSLMEEVSAVSSEDDIKTYVWIRENTEKDARVLSSVEEGHMVTYIGERKNFMDNNYLFIPSVDIKYDNLKTMYNTVLESKALDLFELYDIDYILFTEKTQEVFDLEEINYVGDRSCFKETARFGRARVYKIIC